MEFCKCGSIKRNGNCSNERCPESDLKNKDWIIGGTGRSFKKAVSYAQAVKLIKKLK